MTQSKKVQFQIRKQDVTIELLDGKHRGIYWTYPDTLLKAGPFKSEATAIEDAKLYSQYGTTSKHYLLEGNHRYPKPSTYTNILTSLHLETACAASSGVFNSL